MYEYQKKIKECRNTEEVYWQGYADGYEKVLRKQNLKIRKEVKNE